MLPLPRELLLALIISLAIVVVTEWPFSIQTPEHAILGVKPGEWLIAIATGMLWAPTTQLVKGADRTAERQLRALDRTPFRPDR